MSTQQFAVAAACALATAAVAAGPFDSFKGKMKEGMYETKMEMEIPGMPAGMGKQNMTFQNCVSKEDIEKGQVGKGNDKKGSDSCEVKNFKMSGNTATYTTVCKDPEMTADTTISFNDNGYKMDMKTAMKQNGQVMNMSQRMEGRYVGPCKK
ncbi:MAG TPA: DUF3617 family protein [Usitatibacter sp.]|nr:DUF3617 family protein [Usitatibacter sp.]